MSPADVQREFLGALALAVAALVVIGAVWAWLRTNSLESDPTPRTFHYISRSTRPDVVQVWRGERMECQYNWIDGKDAYPLSRLGRLHAEYEASLRP